MAGLTLGAEWKAGRSHSFASGTRTPLKKCEFSTGTGARTGCVGEVNVPITCASRFQATISSSVFDTACPVDVTSCGLV